MKLRGAFNPRLQVARGALLIALTALILLEVRGDEWAGPDLRMAPFALILGLAVGYPIGLMRFRAVQEVLPEADGQIYLTERPLLSKTRQGSNMLHLYRLILVWAFVIWFGIDAYSHGKYILFGSLTTFILGFQLAAHTFPYLRLWIYLEHEQGQSNS